MIKSTIRKAQENYAKGYISALHKSIDLLKEVYPDDFTAMKIYEEILKEITRVETMRK